MTDPTNIHATCVMLDKAAPTPFGFYDAGVLLLGDSGMGKSDLALRLIEQGALLVSDDRTDLFVEKGKLHARAPAALAGLIEARGLGILSLSFQDSVEVKLAVQLVSVGTVPRMPEPERYIPPPQLALPDAARPPLIRLNAFEASATVKLRWAVLAFAQGLFRNDAAP
ncbi:MAG TPA: HPr kinase/phosphatase C-terminal domain-containing protein [Rhizomicrobium sp.]|jgi:serine kinase of HPr protein (carbohydrate metabolism regulator)|nr:HPr kinase/phosphatase C-terminal domain-containing protein [Rhizomicrobium sp.]